MPPSVTALAKLGIGTVDPIDTGLNFASFDPGVRRESRDTNGTRGTFFKDGNRKKETRRLVNPRFSSEPTAPEWAYLLQWIMGGTPTGTTTKTYPWSDTVAPRFLYFHPNAGEDWFIDTCGVVTANIRASSGEPLSLDLDCIAKNFDDTRSNFPAVTYDQALAPFTLSELTLTVAGLTRQCREFSLSIAGGIDQTRFLNSLTLTVLQRVGASFMLTIDVPSGDNAAGFWKSGIALNGVALSASFDTPNGAQLLLSAPAVKFDPESPAHSPGGEGFLRLTGECYRIGSGSPITITLNPGT